MATFKMNGLWFNSSVKIFVRVDVMSMFIAKMFTVYSYQKHI